MNEILTTLLSTPEGVTAVIKQYKPLIYAVCGELFGMYMDLVNNDDYYAVAAQGDWKRFKALTDAGFSEDQAMALMLSSKQALKDYAAKTSGASIKLN